MTDPTVALRNTSGTTPTTVRDGADSDATTPDRPPAVRDQKLKSNALFAFEQSDAADRAGDDLRALGIPLNAIRVHVDPTKGSGARAIDEQVTGGLLSNLKDLFQGIFEWSGSQHDASAFEETVRRGGGVVSVDAFTAAERSQVDAAMDKAQCVLRTEWSNVPVRG